VYVVIGRWESKSSVDVVIGNNQHYILLTIFSVDPQYQI